MLKIQQKIVLVSCLVAWAATLATGFIDFRDDVARATTQAERALATRAEFIQKRIRDRYMLMVEDAELIARALPIAAAARAGAITRLTAEDRDQLARVFRVLMSTREDYTEIALVDFAGGGEDIVRVARIANGSLPDVAAKAPPHQWAGDPAYAIAGNRAPGSWAFGRLSLKMRPGIAASRLRPTQSLVYVLSDNLGRQLAFLVISVDARKLAAKSLAEGSPNNSVFVVDSTGNLLAARLSEQDLSAGTFGVPPSHADLPAAFQFKAPGEETGTRLVQERGQVFLSYEDVSQEQPFPEIQVVVTEPVSEMLALPQAEARRSLLIGGLATFLSGIFAGLFAIWITRPLAGMAEALRLYEWHGAVGGLPVHLRDEVGDVARAFTNLIARLGQSEGRARAIVESITDALIVIDPVGTVLEFSEGAERIFGYDKEDVIGRNVELLMPEPYRSQHAEYLARFRRSGKSAVMDKTRVLQGLRRSGEVFPIELTVSVLDQSGIIAYVGIVRDITERLQAEEMKNAFISTVNHELRTPLTSIHAALTLLRDHSDGKLDARAARLLQLAEGGCARLTQLVNDILDLRRIETGLLDMHARTIELRDLVGEVVARYRSLAERFRVRFDLIGDGAPVFVRVDPGRFEQALVNLLSNAAKFSPAGESIAITVLEREPQWVRVSVADRGPGIPDSLRQKIFARFAQPGLNSNRLDGSGGLGLAVTRSLVEAFGGRVGFESEIGAGSTFHIDLPVCDPGQEAETDG